MTWLLTNWKLVAILSTVAASFVAGWHIRAISDAAAFEVVLSNQRQADIAECSKDKHITEEASHDYEDKIAALNDRLASLRLHPTHCVVPTSGTSGRRNATTAQPEHGGQDGVTDTALYDFAAEAETYRLRLKACQQFVLDTWREKRQ